MLPDNVTLELFEAMEDQRITHSEVTGMMTSVFGSAITGMVMVFGMLMFNKVIKGNPGGLSSGRIRLWVVWYGLDRGGNIGWHAMEEYTWGSAQSWVSIVVRKGYTKEAYVIEAPTRYQAIKVARQQYPKDEIKGLPEPHSGNPRNPDGITSDIIFRAGLKEYEYRYFPPVEEERKPRLYAYTRRRTIGSYEVQMTRTDGSCSIKLYEFLPGWKRKLRATWTGIGVAECDRKFLEVVETVIQVRFEHKTQLMR